MKEYYMQDKWPGIWNEPLSELKRMKAEHGMYHAWRETVISKLIWQQIALIEVVIIIGVIFV